MSTGGFLWLCWLCNCQNKRNSHDQPHPVLFSPKSFGVLFPFCATLQSLLCELTVQSTWHFMQLESWKSGKWVHQIKEKCSVLSKHSGRSQGIWISCVWIFWKVGGKKLHVASKKTWWTWSKPVRPNVQRSCRISWFNASSFLSSSVFRVGNLFCATCWGSISQPASHCRCTTKAPRWGNIEETWGNQQVTKWY